MASYSAYPSQQPTTAAKKRVFAGKIVPIVGNQLTDYKGTSRNFGDVIRAQQIAQINALSPAGAPTYRTLEDYNNAKSAFEAQTAVDEARPVDFTVTKTVKQPEIATATGNLLTAPNQTASTSAAFKDFLDQARGINEQSRQQLTKDQAAFDTSKLEQSLPQNDLNYQTQQNTITGDMRSRNARYSKQTNDMLSRLTGENKAYEGAAQAVADRAYAEATKRNSLYQLGTGTPTSGSGQMTSRAINAYQDINVPLQRELSQRRYSQLANIERPYQTELYGNDMGLLNRESGLASDFANRTDATSKFLQNLRMQVAGKSREQAQSYLTNLGIPLEIGQRIMAGDIANLGGIQRLDELANYYTVQTPYDASREPVVASYPINYPNRSYTPGQAGAMPVSSSSPTYGSAASGINADGSARSSALAPDFSSRYTPALDNMRRSYTDKTLIYNPYRNAYA